MKKFEINYKKVIDEYGEYYLPDFEDDENCDGDSADNFAEESELTIGKYGRLRLQFLKDHRRVQYRKLVVSGELRPHLLDVQKQASDFFHRVVPELAKKRGVTDELKIADQMKWVAMMNNVVNVVDEMIFAEIINV